LNNRRRTVASNQELSAFSKTANRSELSGQKEGRNAGNLPLETDSNVSEQVQESHVELINETARMKHYTLFGEGPGNNDNFSSSTVRAGQSHILRPTIHQ